MAKIGFNLPKPKAQDYYNAFALRFSYQEKVVNESGQLVDNPESKRKFANRMLANMANEIVKDYQRGQAIVSLPEPEGAGIEPDETP